MLMNFLFLVTVLFASSEIQNEMKHHLRRLQQTCDPVCDATSDTLHFATSFKAKLYAAARMITFAQLLKYV